MASHRIHAHIGTVRQLEIILAVHEHRSISAAARALHLTQPSVSMQLAKLADAVGLPLYYQVGKQLQFTEAGLTLVKSAREILRCYEYLDLKLADLRGLQSGTLQLAVVTTAKYFIPHLIGDFYEQHPQLDIRFRVGNRRQIIERTAEDEDDFYVFSHPPDNPDLELVEFLPNRLLAIAPEKHPLAGRTGVPLEEFAQCPFLRREEGSGTRHAIERFLQRQGIELNVRMTIESNEAIKHAVMSGLGVSILSEHTLSFGGSAGLAILDVQELPIETRWYLARRRSRPLSPAAREFLDYARRLGEAPLESGLGLPPQ
ncbi:LysR family transcriptional regulator [Microbulbifer yueqingensis]|uniref:DNA-binding transcriptional regulator, LysR family n=1 Tax=Microbulbifer yueqingensis TaxID=658219 RepID=A0A1G9DYJ6_9GAMM|nr:LysR family transcriptional regulator [Microbulbifer yueqingensis]SDK68898.1 DNA-binding transcriptional regulator, LysR family [Microbulbifer yueqingensis]